MKVVPAKRLVATLLLAGPVAYTAMCPAQDAKPTGARATTTSNAEALTQRIETLDAAVSQAQQRLFEAQREMLQLREQVRQLREQFAQTVPSSSDELSVEASSSAAASPSAEVPLEEREQALEAAVKLHEQTKVESASKYPVRLTGLVLFNGFLNTGVPDNLDLPSVALLKTSASGNGNLGASLRQTILGIDADGPRIAGARTAASVSIDFFAGLAYSGYGSSTGTVRMRTATVDFLWPKDSIQIGQAAPLISPLSPSSYATVAEPSLAGAGNLWVWAPQLRLAHLIDLRKRSHVLMEFGLWDSAGAGYNTNPYYRTASPGESSRQPAYEGRLSYRNGEDRGLQLGTGGYYGRQSYPGYGVYGTTKHLESWASTFDWRVPFGRHVELTGEAYRGRSLGDLGGGTYKDVVAGTNPVTGANQIRGLNAIGGWTQAKARLSQILEANVSIGQDNGFAGDFHALVLPLSATAAQLNARNRMAVGNLIFRPKTYIILSPEYRRIWSWPIHGSASTLDVFTLTAGYQF